ncbi:MAG: hypothetical protein E6J17_09280 [Chloroflexi bacterium]|nr:MAG: hypothetical protein E6J17_09280 [Chloroflexota bacterium]
MSAAIVALDPPAAEQRYVRRAARFQRLAAVLAVVAVIQAIALLVISAVGRYRFDVQIDVPTIGFLGSIVLYPVVGALIVQRRPFSRVAWLMVLLGLALGVGLVLFGYGIVGVDPDARLPLALQALVVSALFFTPSIGSAAALLFLVFPTDRLPGPRWRAVVVIAIAGAVLYDVGTLFHRGYLSNEKVTGPPNPLFAPPELGPVVDFLAIAGNTLVTLAVVLAAVSVVARYRKAEAVEAAQIRWIALVAGISAPAWVVAGLQLGPVSDLAFETALLLFACLPLAIGIAITRYRLYEIDRLINRTLVYGSLTAILAGIFTAAIGLAQRLFIATTGQTSDAAIVLTTLVVATLYAPLRKRLEAIVDRRFKYEERPFGAYRDEVLRILRIVDVDRAARRLAVEALDELQATGAAVVDRAGQPVATAGAWPVEGVIRLSIPGPSKRLATIVVGPRVDGRPHDARSVGQLEELATLVGAAVRPG